MTTTALPRLLPRLLPRAALTTREREAMRALLDRHFLGVTAAGFAADLAAKDWALLLHDADGGLLGFSTFAVYETRAPGGDPVRVVYSGDTIVARSAWGTPALAGAWIAAVRAVTADRPELPLYWLLLSSGFRTYRFLTVFWQRFEPRPTADEPGGPTPESRLLRHLASERFGATYDPEASVVRLAAPQVLRGDLAEVPAGRQRDPHVAFFLRQNPGWRAGDELACLTRIAADNLTAAGRRMWRHGVVGHAPAAAGAGAKEP